MRKCSERAEIQCAFTMQDVCLCLANGLVMQYCEAWISSFTACLFEIGSVQHAMVRTSEPEQPRE